MDPSENRLQPDVRELILCQDERLVCETYIFEPAPDEEELGHLIAVGEIEDRGGVGRELLDLVMSALQKEYYRDPKRAATTSFELALHQANLILHDTNERGIRDWMGHFHVAVAVLAGSTLHISVAGEADVLLSRKSSLTEISEGLSHSPITDPLQTFSQIASGTVKSHDTIFLGTANFPHLFRQEDLLRFSIDHSAATITTRLQQLYMDQASSLPVSMVVISLLPQYIVHPREEEIIPSRQSRRSATPIHQESLRLRQPLVIYQSGLRSMLIAIGRLFKIFWQKFKVAIWPYIKYGSVRGGRALYHVSRSTGLSVRTVAARQINRIRPGQAEGSGSSFAVNKLPRPKLSFESIRSGPGQLMHVLRRWIGSLPRTSKIFAVVTVVFAVALVISLVLLQQKRAEDAAIQRASEILHEARTKKDAAETALIYDNRDQASQLLAEAEKLAQELTLTGLYADEIKALQGDIVTQQDRLQKVVRASSEQVRVIGDFVSVVSKETPKSIFFIDDNLYSFNPANNALVKMSLDGSATIVQQTTQGIGFFSFGTEHLADKTVILVTDEPSIALFDTKDNSLHKQDVSFASGQPKIAAVAPFGSRLYLYDQSTNNIHQYNKTLRGYSGGSPWIVDEKIPKDTIVSMGIDGNIFTLHRDGTIRRMFKGEQAEFEIEPVEPSLNSASKLIAREELQYIYVLDVINKRVVTYTKDGELVRQILLEVAPGLSDITVGPNEDTLYALDGTRVLAVSLGEE